MTLLRMVPLSGGRIVLDGEDTSTIGLNLLRSRLGIVPQDPALFRGTVRENLDPWNKFSDAELWEALRDTGLQERINVLTDSLYTTISDGGQSLSAGERQLLCLTRAALHNARVIVLDEASSYVDTKHDNAVQYALRKRLQESTLLIIAHRLQTIVDCDKIVVVDDGRIAEGPASPSVLLGNKESLLYSLASELGGDTLNDLQVAASQTSWGE